MTDYILDMQLKNVWFACGGGWQNSVGATCKIGNREFSLCVLARLPTAAVSVSTLKEGVHITDYQIPIGDFISARTEEKAIPIFQTAIEKTIKKIDKIPEQEWDNRCLKLYQSYVAKHGEMPEITKVMHHLTKLEF